MGAAGLVLGGQLVLPLISILIEEFEDHGRERERKRSETGILFK